MKLIKYNGFDNEVKKVTSRNNTIESHLLIEKLKHLNNKSYTYNRYNIDLQQRQYLFEFTHDFSTLITSSYASSFIIKIKDSVYYCPFDEIFKKLEYCFINDISSLYKDLKRKYHQLVEKVYYNEEILSLTQFGFDSSFGLLLKVDNKLYDVTFYHLDINSMITACSQIDHYMKSSALFYDGIKDYDDYFFNHRNIDNNAFMSENNFMKLIESETLEDKIRRRLYQSGCVTSIIKTPVLYYDHNTNEIYNYTYNSSRSRIECQNFDISLFDTIFKYGNIEIENHIEPGF